jgi:hypothetical protein
MSEKLRSVIKETPLLVSDFWFAMPHSGQRASWHCRQILNRTSLPLPNQLAMT